MTNWAWVQASHAPSLDQALSEPSSSLILPIWAELELKYKLTSWVSNLANSGLARLEFLTYL